MKDYFIRSWGVPLEGVSQGRVTLLKVDTNGERGLSLEDANDETQREQQADTWRVLTARAGET